MKRKDLTTGWKEETTEEKMRWFLSLTPSQRYHQVVEVGESILSMRSKEPKRDRRSFKTIQILEQK